MRLSRNFFLHEFLKSQTATRSGIDMTPPDAVVASLRRLCTTILQPLRDDIGSGIHVTSGYRPAQLNMLIGGSENSDHIIGLAADVYAPRVETLELAEMIQQGADEDEWPVKQCIHEFGGWVHVSVRPESLEEEAEFLTAYKHEGMTRYVKGLRAVDVRTRGLA